MLDRATRPVAPTFHIAPNQVKVWAAAILEGVEADTGIKKKNSSSSRFSSSGKVIR